MSDCPNEQPTPRSDAAPAVEAAASQPVNPSTTETTTCECRQISAQCIEIVDCSKCGHPRQCRNSRRCKVKHKRKGRSKTEAYRLCACDREAAKAAQIVDVPAIATDEGNATSNSNSLTRGTKDDIGEENAREDHPLSLENGDDKSDVTPPKPEELLSGLDEALCNGILKDTRTRTCTLCGSLRRCTNQAGCKIHIEQTDADKKTDKSICICDGKTSVVGEAVLSRPIRSGTIRSIPSSSYRETLLRKQFGKGFYTFKQLCDPDTEDKAEVDHSCELQLVAFGFNRMLDKLGFDKCADRRKVLDVCSAIANANFNLRFIQKKVNRAKGTAVKSFLDKLARSDVSDVSFQGILEAQLKVKLGDQALAEPIMTEMARATCEFLRRLKGSQLSETIRTQLYCITERVALQMGLPLSGCEAVAAAAA